MPLSSTPPLQAPTVVWLLMMTSAGGGGGWWLAMVSPLEDHGNLMGMRRPWESMNWRRILWMILGDQPGWFHWNVIGIWAKSTRKSCWGKNKYSTIVDSYDIHAPSTWWPFQGYTVYPIFRHTRMSLEWWFTWGSRTERSEWWVLNKPTIFWNIIGSNLFFWNIMGIIQFIMKTE